MYPTGILLKSFVKPFYRTNAGLFLFLITVMFCIVNKVDGAALLEYHTVMVMGMLANPGFLLFVFSLWLLYARKCHQFIIRLLQEPEYAFCSVYNCLDRRPRYFSFFVTQLLMMVPVFLYAVFVVYIAWSRHYYWHVAVVPAYLLFLPGITAQWQLQQLNNEDAIRPGFVRRLFAIRLLPAGYVTFLLRYVSEEQKIAFLAIKLFSCSMLYFYPRNTALADLDLSFTFLLFNFGILSHGVLIMYIRHFEEMYLSLYRGMPVSVARRFLQYAGFYLILLLPEIIVGSTLISTYIHFTDVVLLLSAAYGVIF